MARRGKTPKADSRPASRRAAWLVPAALVAAAAAAVALATRDPPSDPFLDLDDAAVADVAFAAFQQGGTRRAALAAFGELVRRDAEDAFAWAWKARLEVGAGDLEAAEASYSAALRTLERRLFAEDDREVWTRATREAQLQLDLRRVRSRLAAASRSSSSPAPPRAAAMPRVHWRDVDDASATPMIVTGYAPRVNVTPAVVAGACGGAAARPMRFDAVSTAWAGMVESPETSVGAFLEAADPAGGVLFDWPLQHCEALLHACDVPHFARRALSSYGPSLFVSFGASGGGAHVDAGSTHFWQFVSAGAKEYRVVAKGAWDRLFPDEERWRAAFFRDPACSGLFGEPPKTCDDGFGAAPVDLFDDAALAHTAVDEVWRGVVGPGEAVFVPADAPHQVRNAATEPTVATSMNYIDGTNRDEALLARLEAPAYHPKWLARLNVRGRAVAGSTSPWYARQQIALPPDADLELRDRGHLVPSAGGMVGLGEVLS